MKFTTEYSKLKLPLFTTIRKNSQRCQVGNCIGINTPKQSFLAQVIAREKITKLDITNTIANFDADCSEKELIKKLEGWYGKKFDDFILIVLLKV